MTTPRERVPAKPPSRPRVVVGVDGSPTSSEALDWAVDEATRRGALLHVVHATEQGSTSADHTRTDHRSTTDALTSAVARAHALAPRLHVSTQVSGQSPYFALYEAAVGAACLVVGGGGRGQLMGALLGTTSLDLAAYGPCPVVVVRQPPQVAAWRPGVVVGADGSIASSAAVGYAFGQASARQLPLTVVHVCPPDVVRRSRSARSRADGATAVEAEQAMVADGVSAWTQRYPDVTVNRHVLQGNPVSVLLDQSAGAELTVVGSRGLGGLTGKLLGSVSQAVLQHAHSPVAVVR